MSKRMNPTVQSKSLKRILAEHKGYVPAFGNSRVSPNKRHNLSKASFKNSNESITKMSVKNEQLSNTINKYLDEQINNTIFDEWDVGDIAPEPAQEESPSRSPTKIKKASSFRTKSFEVANSESFRPKKVVFEQAAEDSSSNEQEGNTFENTMINKHTRNPSLPNPSVLPKLEGKKSIRKSFRKRTISFQDLANDHKIDTSPSRIHHTDCCSPDKPNVTVENEISPKILAFIKLNNQAIGFISRVGLNHPKKLIDELVDFSKQNQKRASKQFIDIKSAFEQSFQNISRVNEEYSSGSGLNSHKDSEKQEHPSLPNFSTFYQRRPSQKKSVLLSPDSLTGVKTILPALISPKNKISKFSLGKQDTNVEDMRSKRFQDVFNRCNTLTSNTGEIDKEITVNMLEMRKEFEFLNQKLDKVVNANFIPGELIFEEWF